MQLNAHEPWQDVSFLNSILQDALESQQQTDVDRYWLMALTSDVVSVQLIWTQICTKSVCLCVTVCWVLFVMSVRFLTGEPRTGSGVVLRRDSCVDFGAI